MIITQLIILQIIAHLLSDFIFQPQKWCDRKERKIFTVVLFYHIAIVFATSYLLSFDLGFWKATILISAIHFVIDILKSYAFRKTKIKNLFFIDQILHLITIFAIVIIYNQIYGINFLLEMNTYTLAIIAGFLLCAKPTNIIIKFLFQSFAIETPVDDKNDEEKSLPNAGKLIGISERFLTLALIILGQYEAVGFIIAAKSILRFNATKKSEYVLVGTLLSFGIATFTGIVINLLK